MKEKRALSKVELLLACSTIFFAVMSAYMWVGQVDLAFDNQETITSCYEVIDGLAGDIDLCKFRLEACDQGIGEYDRPPCTWREGVEY